MILKKVIFSLICFFQLININACDDQAIIRVGNRLRALSFKDTSEKQLKRITKECLAIAKKAPEPKPIEKSFLQPLLITYTPRSIGSAVMAADDKLALKIARDEQRRRDWFREYTSSSHDLLSEYDIAE